MAEWIQSFITGITVGSVYALIALGFVTIYRSSRIVNMAQGSFVMFGALFTFSMLSSAGLPFWLACIVGAILVVVLAMAMYLIVLKPILKVSLVSMILCTVALSVMFENLALLYYGAYPKTIPAFTGENAIEVGGVFVNKQNLWTVAIMIVILIALYFLNNRTVIGKRMTATATNPVAASLCGISVNAMVLFSFAISALIGAVAGITICNAVPMTGTSGSVYGMNGFIAAVLGGWGSSTGAVVGGLALGIVQSLATTLIPAGYKNVVAFVILLIVLYFRPQGLLGKHVPEGEV